MYLNTEGYANTSNGYFSLYYNTTGFYNTANGYQSLYKNTWGNQNTANGSFSLYSNTTGSYNTANGSQSLYLNTTGYYNTATGVASLRLNTTGFGNTANGYGSLNVNSTGYNNTSNGSYSLLSNTTGVNNSSLGDSSLYNNITGSNNVAAGFKAGASQSTYNKCTFIGVNADASKNNLVNATAIGYGAKVDTKDEVRIGNTAVASIGGQVSWTSFSDERIKKNIKENVPGLAFIKLLRPVTYNFNLTKENELMGIENDKFEDADMEKINFTGLLAQEVDKAAKKIGYDFSGVDKTGNIMGLRYSEFVVPLVKAVQELSKENDDLKNQMNEMKALILQIQQGLPSASDKNTDAVTAKSSVLLNSIILEQNIPNPFTKTTIINYTLPSKFTTAYINITDKNGKLIKQANISGSGKGQLIADAATLTQGAYHYALIVDGKMIESKQMILAK